MLSNTETNEFLKSDITLSLLSVKSPLSNIIFIDEVYSLAPRESDKDSFSKEVLDTLTAFLLEH